MKKFYFLFFPWLLFAGVYNHAPKVENPKVEKPLVVVIPSYNNKRYYKKNLDSVFTQKYKNFRVIYTSDASTDETAELVLAYVNKLGVSDKFTFIDNKVNMGAVYNIHTMVYSCANDEVVLLLDGDDHLYHDKVFQRVNQAYADDRVWMTYGSDWSPLVRKSHSSPTPISRLKKGECKKMKWSWSHLRTFYAGLYKCIPDEKLQRNGSFFKVGGDVAMMHAMLELGREHVFYIPETLYYYNTSNPICDFKIHLRDQQGSRRYIWQQKPLEGIPSKEYFLNQ